MKLTDIEQINARIDPIHPSDDDLTALVRAFDGAKANPAFFMYGTDRLRSMVEQYARMYRGSFAFMVAMQEAVRAEGKLTHKQASGVMNCLLADHKRKMRRVGDE